MKLLDFYRKESTVSFSSIIFMAAISGISNAGLLIIINKAAETASYEKLNFRLFLMFAITMAVFVISKRYLLNKSTMLSENVIKQIRIRIMDKIRHCKLSFLEELGGSEVYNRLTQDTNQISQSSTIVINAGQSAIMVLFASIYMAFLSKTAFVITLIAVSFAVMIYLSKLGKIHSDLQISSEKETKFFDSLNDILGGFKELKVNTAKSNDIFREFKQIGDEAEQLKVNVGIQFVNNFIFANSFFYILMAVIVFLLPSLSETYTDVIFKTTAAVLFIINPLGGVVEAVPYLSKANVAIENIYKLENILDTAGKDAHDGDEKIKFISKIQLENILFSYTDKEGNPLFTVGPVNLTIPRGELLFIVGGNGSGKSTLLKLITGMYYPLSGRITLDDDDIRANYASFRELFSIIFTDFHLFNKLYGLEDIDINKLNDLLKTMELFKKTKYVEDRFTNINLSTGQRKRLALIVALMEDKPIYIFDEVAADQDPEFKKYFYEVLLKKLKLIGKTIIAVSHDEQYFHVADRVLKMEYGSIYEYDKGGRNG